MGSVHPCAQNVLLSPRCVAKHSPVDKHASCLLSSQHAACESAVPVAALLQAVPALLWPLMP